LSLKSDPKKADETASEMASASARPSAPSALRTRPDEILQGIERKSGMTGRENRKNGRAVISSAAPVS
jgi:hypothetical protein